MVGWPLLREIYKMPIFKEPVFNARGNKHQETPEGTWTKCPSCKDIIHNLALAENLFVCTKCSYHFTLGAWERIAHLVDPGSFKEHDAKMVAADPLKFRGVATYKERLQTYREKTGLVDAVITGEAAITQCLIGLIVMDFHFLAATMGSVVGEKVTRLVEWSTCSRRPVIAICASGGARIYESIFSLMQMAKTSGALALHARAGLPYIVVLSNPTYAGVMASFASLGDVILAEPRSMIGFAGPRVIRETTHQNLPEGFQTAEFLEKHGLLDHIVHRTQLRPFLARILSYLCQT